MTEFRDYCGSLSLMLLALAGCSTQSATPSGGAAAPAPRTVASDQSRHAQILRGREVVISSACADCHGGGSNVLSEKWLVGATKDDSFPVGPINTYPRNLTPDMATGTGKYSERQIFNALRYGLRPSATPDVEITSSTPGQGNFPAIPHYMAPSMPWAAWRHMPDQDLWAIAAYLKNGVKPVNHEVPAVQEPPDHWAEVTNQMLATEPYPAAPHPTANETAVATPAVVRGRELVIRKDCGGCHGGGPNPLAKGYLVGVTSPDDGFSIGPFRTFARNLTPDNTTGLGRFSERQIFNSLRYGLRPGETPDVEITSSVPGEGNFPARPKFLAPPMPWPSWRHMPDADLWAIAAYLKQGLKPVANKVADSEGPPDFWVSAYTVENIGPHPAPPFPTARERGNH